MAVLGADPDQLRDLAKQMRLSDEAMAKAAKRIGGQLRASNWTGSDARDFEVRWRNHEARLISSGRLLHKAADDLERHAFEQEDASAAGVCPVPPGGLGSAPESPLLTEVPTRTETYWVDAEGAAEIGLDGRAVIGIDHLADGTAIVWLEGLVGASIEDGLGARGGTDDGGLGAGLFAQLRAGETSRVGWHMDGHDVDEFIVRALVSRAVDRGTGDFAIPDDWTLGDVPVLGGVLPEAIGGMNAESVLNPVGRTISDVFELTGLDIGDPHYREHSFDVGAEAGGRADLGIALGTTGLAAGLSAGLRTSPEGRSVVFSGSGSMEGDVAGNRHGGTTHREVEIPIDGDGSRHMKVTTTTRHGDQQIRTVELHDAPNGPLKELVDEVASGDPLGAGEDLSDLMGTLDEPLHRVTTYGDVSRDAVEDIGAEVAAGPKVKIRGGLGREIVDYDR